MSISDALTLRARKVLARPELYAGRRFACPLCGGHFRRMRRAAGRKNALCPGCNSRERHRVLWLFLEHEMDILTTPYRLLHFAPEASLSLRLGGLENLEYVTGDLDPERAAEQIDITDIPKPDGSFDLVLVSHVLEHVPDDRKAISELYRVLRPGGRALLQHPVYYERDTYEDWSITSREGRLHAFFQEDHVRLYGRDLIDRLREPGFDVKLRQYREELSPAPRDRYRLDEGTATETADDIYVCRKPVVGSAKP